MNVSNESGLSVNTNTVFSDVVDGRENVLSL